MFIRLYRHIEDDYICFYVEYNDNFNNFHMLSDILQADILQNESLNNMIEIGPKLDIITPWCSNVLTIFKKIGLKGITRIEHSFITNNPRFDKMTHEIYDLPPTYFPKKNNKDYIYEVNDISEFSKQHRLGFDDQDIDFYNNYFSTRKPTNIELFDIGQSNSEHSRHWFFNGELTVDGIKRKQTLMQLVKDTLKQNTNSLVAFKDNSSAIRGTEISYLYPVESQYILTRQLFHPI